MLKQGLQQKLQQKLSPLQIQTIKLLELPTLELEQKIRKEIEENPVLDGITESGDPEDDSPKNVSLSEYPADDPTPSYKLYVNNQGKDHKPQYNTFSVKESFQENLVVQLGYRKMDERSRSIAVFIIGSLDDDGYLRRDLESLSYDILLRLNIETDEQEVEKILKVIQEFEPAGVGARNLQECLLLQISPKNEAQNRARTILEEYFEEFTKKHYAKISSKMGITQEELKEAIDEIIRLNPRPGGQIDDSYDEQAQQIPYPEL
jgi:RNA polymerase sigma-54 factor